MNSKGRRRDASEGTVLGTSPNVMGIMPPTHKASETPDDEKYKADLGGRLPLPAQALHLLKPQQIPEFLSESRAREPGFADFFDVLASPLGYFELLRFLQSQESEDLHVCSTSTAKMAKREVRRSHTSSSLRGKVSSYMENGGEAQPDDRGARPVLTRSHSTKSTMLAKNALYSTPYKSLVSPLLFLCDCYAFRHQGACLPALAERIVDIHLEDGVRMPPPDILEWAEMKNLRWCPDIVRYAAFEDFERDCHAGRFQLDVDAKAQHELKFSRVAREGAVAQLRKNIQRGELLTGFEFSKLELAVVAYLHAIKLPMVFFKSPFYKEFVQFLHLRDMDTTDKAFQVYRQIGKGGFGVVSAVKRTQTGHLYALKSFNATGGRMRSRVRSAQHELNTLTRMSRVDFIMGFAFSYVNLKEQSIRFGFEMCTGGDLKYHLRLLKRFAKRQVVYYAARIALALNFLHRAGFVHRDLKPANILLDYEGRPKLCDFGLARPYTPGSRLVSIGGTIGYMSPEMITPLKTVRGRSDGTLSYGGYDVRSDWFSFGVTVYELFFGFNPFKPEPTSAHEKMVLADPENEPWLQYVQLVNDCSREPTFPKEADREVCDICFALFHHNPTRRLGSRGIADVLNQRIFQNLSIHALVFDKITPPIAPSSAAIHAPPSEGEDPGYRKVHSPTPTPPGSPLRSKLGRLFRVGSLGGRNMSGRHHLATRRVSRRDSESQPSDVLTEEDEVNWTFYNFEMMDLEILRVVQTALSEDLETEKQFPHRTRQSLFRRLFSVLDGRQVCFTRRIRNSAVPELQRHRYRAAHHRAKERRASVVGPLPFDLAKRESVDDHQRKAPSGKIDIVVEGRSRIDNGTKSTTLLQAPAVSSQTTNATQAQQERKAVKVKSAKLFNPAELFEQLECEMTTRQHVVQRPSHSKDVEMMMRKRGAQRISEVKATAPQSIQTVELHTLLLAEEADIRENAKRASHRKLRFEDRDALGRCLIRKLECGDAHQGLTSAKTTSEVIDEILKNGG